MTSEMLSFETLVKYPELIYIKWISEDPNFYRPQTDLYDEQQKGIPLNFGKKNPKTTEQPVFFCSICDCEVKSLPTIRAHVRGSRHIQNEYKYHSQKRKMERIRKRSEDENDPCNSSFIEANVNHSDKDLAHEHQQRCESVVGLKYVCEYRSKDGKFLYKCALCDVIGSSAEIYDHFLVISHQVRYFQKTYQSTPITVPEVREQVRYEYKALGFKINDISKIIDEKQIGDVFSQSKTSSVRPNVTKRPKTESPQNSNIDTSIVADEENNNPFEAETKSEAPIPSVQGESKVKMFHRRVAEWVKRCLSPYYAPNENYPKKIPDNETFSKLAKELSHKYRSIEKDSWVSNGLSVSDIVLTNDMKDRIKLQIQMHFEVSD